MKKTIALVRGTLDVLVLRTLAEGPLHGYEITRWLEQRSGGALDVEDGALYHALIRLEQRRAIRGEWGVTANGRRARYYQLTSAGRKELRKETSRLLEYATMLHTVLADA